MQHSYHSKYQNGRKSRSQSMDTMASTSASDIMTDDDTIDKNTIPKMELLQINYVNKNAPTVSTVSPQQQQTIDAAKMRSIIAFKKQVSNGTNQSEQSRKIPTKSLTRNQNGVSFQHTKNCNPLKYAVYKKHNNSIEKLQYINDNVNDPATSIMGNMKNKNRKKLFGDSTAEKKNTKFENIQFFFDSKGYEQHVDNKIYGCIEGDLCRASTPDEASKSNSWSFRKMPAISPSQPPPLPPANRRNKAAVQIDAKIVPLKQKFNVKATIPSKSDVSRIRQLFPATVRSQTVAAPSKIDETAGSLKKVKKLLDNFENRCSCSDIKPAAPTKVVTKTKRRLTSNDRMNNHPKREQRIAVTNENIAQIFGTDRTKETTSEKPSKDLKRAPTSMSHQICEAIKQQQNSMKHTTAESSRNTCGYKKCTFVNCPMSSSSSSSDDNYCTAQDIHPTKTIEDAHDYYKSNEANEMSPAKDLNDSDYNKDIDSSETINNLRNLQSKLLPSTTVIPELKFTKNNQNFNDSIKCKQITKVDFNSTNIQSKQLNNIVASLHAPEKNQQNNCVKIFISNAAPSIKSISSDSSDLGYYEKMPSSDASSSGCNSSVFDRLSPATSTVACRSLDNSLLLSHKLSGLFPSKLGCDGAIFWNDCYYYDEHACCSCQASSMVVNGDLVKKTGKFICVCDVDQVRFFFIILKISGSFF